MARYLEIDMMEATRISINIAILGYFKHWLTEVGPLLAYRFMVVLNFNCFGDLAISIIINIHCGHFLMVVFKWVKIL
jgi:hypothetical protein